MEIRQISHVASHCAVVPLLHSSVGLLAAANTIQEALHVFVPRALHDNIVIRSLAVRGQEAVPVSEGDCPDPSDLSVLADAVVQTTGDQGALVTRMHPNRFRTAQPNKGHTLAAVLLRERAINCVVTLNFDLALSAALALIGGNDVEIIQGPEQHNQLGTINLVYLHRNANSDADAWILTTNALDEAWRGHWEEVIGTRFISGPMTVFVGL